MTDAPIVIAHRGASGYLPEHTLEAKALAYGYGVDFLEQDVIATRDGELVVLHDLHLDDVTDVAQRFPGRGRPDGRHYAIDFTLAELQALTVLERRRSGTMEPLYAGRFAAAAPRFRIATLDEEIALVRGLNAATGRNVGLYAEIKHPRWHREHGIDLAPLLLEKLAANGYLRATDSVYVQCFDVDELKRVRFELGSELKLVQLVDARDDAHAALREPRRIADVAAYANALGPPYDLLVVSTDERGEMSRDRNSAIVTPSAFARAAQHAGLPMHAYTFRRERLPAYAHTLEALLELFLREIGIDGVFADQPDAAVRVRDVMRSR